jgi:hypothetical protein
LRPAAGGGGCSRRSSQRIISKRGAHHNQPTDPSPRSCPSEVSWWRDYWGAGLFPNGGGSTGYSFLLTERDMCEEPAAARPFQMYVHRAVMTRLAPGARYRYRIESGDSRGGVGGSSGVSINSRDGLPFRAQPRSSPRGRVKFVAYGDMGDPIHAASKSPG